MENLKISKELKAIITKVMEGKELTEKQNEKLTSFLKEMDLSNTQLITEVHTEEPKPEEQPTIQPTLENWEQLTEEQQHSLKQAILKSKYGQGGEHYSIFPTLMDTEINTWLTGEYGQYKKIKSNKTIQSQWKEDGTISILPLEIGKHIQYLVIIQPKKEIKMDIWQLVNGLSQPYTQYTEYNKEATLTIQAGEYIITNIYSNKNKAYSQGKLLSKLFHINGEQLEEQKELKANYLRKDLDGGKVIFREIGKNNHTPTGKTFTSLSEYLGTTQSQGMGTINPLEYIN